MQIPLSLWDFSLWVMVTAIILLATSESLYYGKTGILINKNRLRKASLALGILFMFFVAIRIVEIII